MMRSVFLTLPERAFLPAGPEVALALRGEQEVEPQLFNLLTLRQRTQRRGSGFAVRTHSEICRPR